MLYQWQTINPYITLCEAVSPLVFLSHLFQEPSLHPAFLIGSLDIKYLDKLNSYLGPVLQSPGNSSLLDAGTLRQTVGRHQHSTATVMERVPLSPSSKSVTTYLVDTSTSRGEVSIWSRKTLERFIRTYRLCNWRMQYLLVFNYISEYL